MVVYRGCIPSSCPVKVRSFLPDQKVPNLKASCRYRDVS